MSLKWLAAVALVVAARPALADTCLASATLAAEQAKLTASNTKARDAALAAVGLKPLAAKIVAHGPQSTKPAGNIVWIDNRQTCDGYDEVAFALDKAGKAYRVIPKTTYTEVPQLVCGAPACRPVCGVPPTPIKLAFKLPDNVKYSGEREVAWKTQLARVSYQQACGGTTVPSAPPSTKPAAPPAKSTPLTKTECERLRAENERLRAELDRVRAAQDAEVERQKRRAEEISKSLKN